MLIHRNLYIAILNFIAQSLGGKTTEELCSGIARKHDPYRRRCRGFVDGCAGSSSAGLVGIALAFGLIVMAFDLYHRPDLGLSHQSGSHDRSHADKGNEAEGRYDVYRLPADRSGDRWCNIVLSGLGLCCGIAGLRGKCTDRYISNCLSRARLTVSGQMGVDNQYLSGVSQRYSWSSC